MSWWAIAIIVGIGLVYTVGVFTTLGDVTDNGHSLKWYRDKYGKDLGMLICCTYRGLVIFAWPLVGGLGFIVGLIRDSIRVFFQGTNK